jgi:hypothetical protein
MPETIDERISRRNYLKYLGVAVAGVAIGYGSRYLAERYGLVPSLTKTVTQTVTQSVTPTSSTQLDPFLEKEIYPINPKFAEWLSKENPYYYEFKKDGLDDYEKEVLIKAASLDSLAPFLIKMPEVYTKEAKLEDVLKYINSIKSVQERDFGAAQWILEAGLFMEDKDFSDVEQEFVMQSFDKPDLLRVYVSKFVLDGIQHIPNKSIKVDGKQDDWNGIQPLAADENGDVEVTDPGSDIKAVYVAKDSDNLYVMIQCYDKLNENNLIDLYFNNLPVSPASHFMFGKDGFASWSRNWKEKGVCVAYDEVAEVAFPLKLLNKMFKNSEKIYIAPAVYIPSINKWVDFAKQLEVGIVDDDFDKLKEFNPPNSGKFGYLTDDLLNLPEINGNISKADTNALRQIEAIVKASITDYQLRKGIYLIDEYGTPNQELFSFEVPRHNTQLQVLYWLAQSRNIPREYFKVALAIALTYGSVVTIGDDEVGKAVRSYVPKIFDFVIETDEIIKQHGADWQAKDYPLEADIALVWHGPGQFYPNEKVDVGWGTFNWYRIYSIEKKGTMDLMDFDYLFPRVNTLKEMRNFMLQNFLSGNKPSEVNMAFEVEQMKYRFLYNDKIDEICADLDDYIFVNAEHFNSNINWPINVEGRNLFNSYICNLDWQWENFKNNNEFVGCCVDNAHVQSGLLKSINISCLIGDLGHGFPTYANLRDYVWRTNPYEQNIIESAKTYMAGPGTGRSFNPYTVSIPSVDMFSSYSALHGDARYAILYFPSGYHKSWSIGIPFGYIFRPRVI